MSQIHYDSFIPTDSMTTNNTHTWIVDFNASKHMSGDPSLFIDMNDITPVTIQTDDGRSLTADESGSIRINFISDPSFELADVHITLNDVIYVPELHVNSLSFERITDANIDVLFGKNYSTLYYDDQILARGPKIDGLFTYTAISMNVSDFPETAHYAQIVPSVTPVPNHFPDTTSTLFNTHHVTHEGIHLAWTKRLENTSNNHVKLSVRRRELNKREVRSPEQSPVKSEGLSRKDLASTYVLRRLASSCP